MCRLINPSKSDIGRISKQVIDKTNLKLISDTKVNQWKNSTSAFEWFNNIPNKDQHTFLVFDIEVSIRQCQKICLMKLYILLKAR